MQVQSIHITKVNSASTQIKQALCGGIAGSITRFVTQPFDVLKIRFQMQVEPVKRKWNGISKYTSMFQACRTIYNEEGLRGLWRGHNAGQLMSITYALMQFWSYEQLRVIAKNNALFQDREYMSFFICGGTAGCLGTLFSQPFDTIRTRVVASDKNSPSSTTNSFRGIFRILGNEGVLPLFRGMTFTLCQIYPLVGANFLIYKYLNKFASEFTAKDNQPNKILPSAVLFINGFISGTAAKAIVYPLDFIKKRIQLAGFQADRRSFGQNAQCMSLYECVTQTVRVEGYLGFYKGMTPTLCKSGITSAIYFCVYDNLKMLSKRLFPAVETKKVAHEIFYEN